MSFLEGFVTGVALGIGLPLLWLTIKYAIEDYRREDPDLRSLKRFGGEQ